MKSLGVCESASGPTFDWSESLDLSKSSSALKPHSYALVLEGIIGHFDQIFPKPKPSPHLPANWHGKDFHHATRGTMKLMVPLAEKVLDDKLNTYKS